ncbi:arabinose-5-phosphate isomerase [Deferribacter desulfuricans SSM1]|uniref:Arabinose-5-phosphate isomerase n=1 Tax=Deferribacter desulfuricans (strain DSM 14783 / JCM 11476 / NBRC 101012 / SSM1) TaxID=639282 RepID=D3PD36_DEFDS|nr:KpsF/GutQ family sugar-phosphate isomerase [Deferribacter desulfuricans]BAI80509.1 arabinose-5-phosphate isomerase [Deferribacter desulfuricans SSM1]
MDVIDIAKKALKIEADAIYSLIEKLNDDFVKAVDIIYNCKGRLVVTGMGKSGLIGKKIASTFASTGTPSLFLHPAEGVHGDLGMIVKGDVVLAISNSGETDELVSILPIIKRLGVPLISIVGRLNSTLAKRSDCVLDASVEKEACPLNLAPTASTTAALALGDALAVALLEKRGFKEEDFALFHPSGSLGKRLLLKVSDIFHMGDKVPVVKSDVTVTEAILEMSSKGFGCTTIVDDNGALIGVLTDGDLRRGLEKYKDLFERNVMDIASKNPKTIDEDSLAAKALQIMEKYSITSLIVIDDKKRPYGIVHLHDLLKSGIV